MKKRSLIVVRVIGAIFAVLSFVMGVYSLKDSVINGAEVAMLVFLLTGVYLLIASPQDLKSWIYPFWKE